MRIATVEDVPAVTAAVGSAFFEDPLWSWAFPDSERRLEQYRIWWGFLVESALRYSGVKTTDRCESITVWIPPEGTELTEQEEARVEPLIRELLGAQADRALAAIQTLDGAHPREQPHFYLSLFATHADHRGRGVGMKLLRETLGEVDQQCMPAYLESSNPANDARYESVGFAPIGSLQLPADGPVVSTMWRPAAAV